MSNLGTLGIKPKEKEGNGKKLLIGERAGDFLTKAVSSIPDNRVTRGIGSALDFSELNALTRQGAKAEDWLVNKGAQFAKNRLKIDPRIAALGIGMLIPGAPTNDLKAVKRASKLTKFSDVNKLMDVGAYDKGMRRQLAKIKPDTETWHSWASTPPARFRVGGAELAFKQTGHMVKGLEQHHLVQKRVSSRVVQRVRQLLDSTDPKLKSSVKDLEDIHALPQKYGLEAGSGKGALMLMDKPPHKIHHGEAKRGLKIDGGYQPGLEPAGRHLEELYKEIDNANPKQLKKIYEEFLQDSAVPLKKQAELYQDAYERLSKGEMPSKQLLTKLKNELGLKLEAIDEVKLDENLRQRIPDEMWYSKGR